MDLRQEFAQKTLQAQNDRRSTTRLIGTALDNADTGAAERALDLLRFRATREVLEAAQELCNSASPTERILGVQILGQLGIPERIFPDEVVVVLLELLEREELPSVLSEIAAALGHQHARAGVEPLSRLKNHPDAGLRYSIVYGLLGQESPTAIHTLIELSHDPDEDVRDWATFGLGTMLEADSPLIRNALLDRTTDESSQVRGEALVGLAVRRDRRVIEPLLRELRSVEMNTLALQAAEEIGDPLLLPALLHLAEDLPDDPDLAAAIASCRHKREAHND